VGTSFPTLTIFCEITMTVNPVKKIVTETVHEHPYITGRETLGEVESVVSGLISKYGKRARIEFYGGVTEIIVYRREETDEEMNARIESEMKKEMKRKEKERKEYERLRSIFEKEDQ